MTHETRRTIAADHPSLAGHFPGSPIIPAVVILDEVAAALGEWHHDAQVVGVPAVKFLVALKPEQRFTILLSTEVDGPAGNEMEFSCLADGRTAVRGRLIIRRQSTL